jgi:cyclic-di-AMP phosphodiesterase PgpH
MNASDNDSRSAMTGRGGTSSSWIDASSDMPSFDPDSPRAGLAKIIPRRPRVAWWLALVLALLFAALVTPAITAERWAAPLLGRIVAGEPAPITVRVAPFAGFAGARRGVSIDLHDGGFVVARGEIPDAAAIAQIDSIAAAQPGGPLPYAAFFLVAFVFAGLFAHHMRRSTLGRLVRVQLVALITIALGACAVKAMLLLTPLSVLVVPVAMLSLIGTMVLDRIVGLATGILAALVIGLLGPFDLGVAIMLLVQASTAGLVVAERPRRRWRAAIVAGAVTTVFTTTTYVLITYLTTARLPELGDPLSSPLVAAAIGPAIATVLAVPLTPLYQVLVGEITRGKLVELEDLSNPLLRQIAERAPGTWQHSLMMANLAEIAANAIGANGRLVRVGALYHDLGKSLSPKHFIENLEPGETSPHDRLAPEASCDAIFAHVTEGIGAARKAGLHERIVDFMHMHHGDGVLEYFWGKCREQGNPHRMSIEQFRYPGHPPQSRETAILAICDAVEAASRTLKKPEPAQIDSLVQRIVYGKLHLGQLDESGLSMGDLRRVSDSLRETIRHANHGRIEYPWQKAAQSEPRLDSLDRRPHPGVVNERPSQSVSAVPASSSDAGLVIEDVPVSASASMPAASLSPPGASLEAIELGDADRKTLGIADTADLRPGSLSIIETSPAHSQVARPVESRLEIQALPSDGELSASTFVNPPAARRTTTGEHVATPRTLTPSATLPGPVIIRPHRAAPEPPPSPALVTLHGPNAPSRLPATPVTLTGTVSPFGARTAGPPLPTDLENGTTNPPPLRATRLPSAYGTSEPPPRTTQPVSLPPTTYTGHAAPPFGNAARSGDDDPGRTAPSLPSFGASGPASSPWSTGLADRVDAIVNKSEDEWHAETPIMPPTREELRALLSPSESTQRQSIDELERLHRRARELPPESEILTRRPPITAEVDPEDIEAAIELAPPSTRRTQNLIAVAKPKKSE